MSEAGDADCLCVVDCAGLHAIASGLSNNLKAAFLDYLATGVIGVPTCVWHEFEEIYEDEAALIEKYVTRKIALKRTYQLNAASITDGIGSGFSMSPYDRQTDIYVASIASVEDYTVLTIDDQVPRYEDMGCNVSTLADWIEEQALT